MRLGLLLSMSPDEDLTAEEPYEVITVVTEPLIDHTLQDVVTAFAPNGEQRDATQFLGNAQATDHTPYSKRDNRRERSPLMPLEVEQIGECTLYRAHCMEVLSDLYATDLHTDVLLTDPPYGTGWSRGGATRTTYRQKRIRAPWDIWSLEWVPFVQATTFAIFCPLIHLAELLGTYGKTVRYYIKSNPMPTQQGYDTPSVEPIVIWPRVRYSHGPAHRIAYNDDSPHPCGKPLSIMLWLVDDLSAPGECLLDCFAGSCTTGVAALMRGRKFIGIEQDQAWFDYGCRRIEAATKQLALFPPLPVQVPPHQLTLVGAH
jgi:16S rRNA G966 N2-methylase RsmD